METSAASSSRGRTAPPDRSSAEGHVAPPPGRRRLPPDVEVMAVNAEVAATDCSSPSAGAPQQHPGPGAGVLAGLEGRLAALDGSDVAAGPLHQARGAARQV